MIIEIKIDTTNDTLNDMDRAVLAALRGEVRIGAATTKAAEAAEATTEEAAEPAPAPRKTRSRRAAAKPEPEAEETPAEEEAADEEDIVGEQEPTMADAVALATELVQKQKTVVVKEALGELGVKRVSELKPDQIADFIAAVKG